MPSATVLVVEDDPVILRLLEVNFELEGFTVLLAHDGEEGIDVARAEQPDLVVSDIMMPQASGLELVAALKGDAATSAHPDHPALGQGADRRRQGRAWTPAPTTTSPSRSSRSTWSTGSTPCSSDRRPS